MLQSTSVNIKYIFLFTDVNSKLKHDNPFAISWNTCSNHSAATEFSSITDQILFYTRAKIYSNI